VVLVAGSIFGFLFWKESQREKALGAVTTAVEAEADTDRAVALLEEFIAAGPDDKFAARARERIAALQATAQKRWLDQLAAEVDALPRDAAFEASAQQIYGRYLERYPDGEYVREVKNRIASLPEQLEQYYYRQVQESQDQGPKAKMTAYRRYLKAVPDGSNRSEVEKAMNDLVYEQLRDLEIEIRRCQMEGDRPRCLKRCDEFLAVFATPSTARTVREWRAELRAEQDMADLEAQMASLQDKPDQMRRALQRFIQERPNSPVIEEAKLRLSVIDQQVSEQQQWKKIEAIGRDRSRPVFERIEAIDSYLSMAKNEALRRDAIDLKEALEKEYAAELQRRRAAEAERLRQSQLAQQQAQQQQEMRRLARLNRIVGAMLASSGGRFTDNGDGTFVDTRSGLMWCLLDSHRALGRCQDYDDARRYVSALTTGSFRNWRLPTAAELAGLYKNRPYFPDGDVPWYWTSESFATGYHEKVRVVKPDGTSELAPEYRRSTECGAVRAVRSAR
jgi:hypothetical protein